MYSLNKNEERRTTQSSSSFASRPCPSWCVRLFRPFRLFWMGWVVFIVCTHARRIAESGAFCFERTSQAPRATAPATPKRLDRGPGWWSPWSSFCLVPPLADWLWSTKSVRQWKERNCGCPLAPSLSHSSFQLFLSQHLIARSIFPLSSRSFHSRADFSKRLCKRRKVAEATTPTSHKWDAPSLKRAAADALNRLSGGPAGWPLDVLSLFNFGTTLLPERFGCLMLLFPFQKAVHSFYFTEHLDLASFVVPPLVATPPTLPSALTVHSPDGGASTAAVACFLLLRKWLFCELARLVPCIVGRTSTCDRLGTSGASSVAVMCRAYMMRT